MKAIIYVSYFLLFSTLCFAQKITYSEIQKEDSRDMSFDIIGKIKENIFIFKNARYKYNLSVYNAEDMELKEKVALDFIPEKSFNVDSNKNAKVLLLIIGNINIKFSGTYLYFFHSSISIRYFIFLMIDFNT